MTSTVLIQNLVVFQWREIARHLQRLSPAERRLRFGAAMSDAAIERYADSINFERDKLFGILESGVSLAGVGHLALDPDSGMAELGLSVDRLHRGKGYGFALLDRAKLRAMNLGYKTLYMHCLSENAIMIHLARKAGMQVVTAAGEADAYAQLAEATYGDFAREMIGDQVALIDYLFKQPIRWLTRNTV